MAAIDPAGADPTDFRMRVVAESIRLFAERGYEATTTDEIAAAGGVSRRTLFRQFRSKEDVIFADHENLLAQVADLLAGDDGDPWWAVCRAAQLVFAHFAADPELAQRRSRVVARVPALRDRELVTGYRYQQLFEDWLRQRLPATPPVRIVAYAAAVTGVHNYLLRSMIRGEGWATAAALDAELRRLRDGVDRDGSEPAVTVVSHPPGMSPDEIGRAVAEALAESDRPTPR